MSVLHKNLIAREWVEDIGGHAQRQPVRHVPLLSANTPRLTLRGPARLQPGYGRGSVVGQAILTYQRDRRYQIHRLGRDWPADLVAARAGAMDPQPAFAPRPTGIGHRLRLADVFVYGGEGYDPFRVDLTPLAAPPGNDRYFRQAFIHCALGDRNPRTDPCATRR